MNIHSRDRGRRQCARVQVQGMAFEAGGYSRGRGPVPGQSIVLCNGSR